MGLPDDAIETTASIVWIEDGIIHLQSKGITSTTDTVTEEVAAVRDLTNGVPMPVLFDVRGWQKADPEAWLTLISHMLSLFLAAAFVVDPKPSPQLKTFPDAIDRMLIPVMISTVEAEAVAFLQGYAGPPPSE